MHSERGRVFGTATPLARLITAFAALIVALIFAGFWLSETSNAATSSDLVAQQPTDITECFEEYRQARSSYLDAWNDGQELAPSIATAPVRLLTDCTAPCPTGLWRSISRLLAGCVDTSDPTPPVTPGPVTADPVPSGSAVYVNDFSNATDRNRIDHFVQYRDPWVINHDVGRSDHAADGSINCSAPEQTRPQTRENPHGHIYQCFPGGNSAAGHMMAYAMDTSGYGFTGGLPDQVFENIEEVSVDINTTSAGGRNFIEIKVLPADQTFVNAMPCGPDLPCNDGWDYDDVNGVGASTISDEGTGLIINTPTRPDGYHFDQYNSSTAANGDVTYRSCDLNTSYCFRTAVHGENTGIRDRFTHVFKDNGDGTLSFGVDDGDTMHWVTSPGEFPDGPVRVVIAFHNYTGTKDGNGPGFDGNVSPTTGGFTWHWDNLAVTAGSATPSATYFGGHSADRIVTPDGCIAFSQGQRTVTSNRDIAPQLLCDGRGWE